jgi:hypothetical protein
LSGGNVTCLCGGNQPLPRVEGNVVKRVYYAPKGRRPDPFGVSFFPDLRGGVSVPWPDRGPGRLRARREAILAAPPVVLQEPPVVLEEEPQSDDEEEPPPEDSLSRLRRLLDERADLKGRRNSLMSVGSYLLRSRVTDARMPTYKAIAEMSLVDRRKVRLFMEELHGIAPEMFPDPAEARGHQLDVDFAGKPVFSRQLALLRTKFAKDETAFEVARECLAMWLQSHRLPSRREGEDLSGIGHSTFAERKKIVVKKAWKIIGLAGPNDG